jgi:hypothetical protein
MAKTNERYELQKGLYYFPPEEWIRAEADPILLKATANTIGLKYFLTTLLESEESIPVGEFHLAISHIGQAWGMARFEDGDKGVTPVVHVESDGIEDAAQKIYDLLGLDRHDLITLSETFGSFE